MKYAKVKMEYDKQKVDYEAEYKEQMKALEEKRESPRKRPRASTSLLERYQAIKARPGGPAHRGPCGCNMSLPSVTLEI